ncbi:hypothetical protein ABZ319_19675 [Nocardia sp. NPDC005978]|uniref:hypothetical protein n=1 Tax=Nocardia sp. NPDC005978 TaxID=3156725 RepID=UPI00339E9F05
MNETDPFDDLDPGELQLAFELGAAHARGETPDNGWKMYREFVTPLGVRRYSNVRILVDGRVQAREYRARMNDPATFLDLEMDRYLLENGIVHQIEWIVGPE